MDAQLRDVRARGRRAGRWCSDACIPELDEDGEHRHTEHYRSSQLAERFPTVLAEAAMLKALFLSGTLGMSGSLRL